MRGQLNYVVDVQIGADNSDEMAIPRLQMIPTLWVPYFLGLQTPEQALKVMQQLVAGLETEELRVRTAPLVNWCLAACVKAGRAAAPKKRSVLDIRWVTPVLVAERQVIRWMSMRLAAFRSSVCPVAPTWQGDPNLGAAGTVTTAAAPAISPRGESKEYSPYERLRIRRACGLILELSTDRDLPAIYATMLVEGRTVPKVEAVLQNFLLPTDEELDPVKVYVSPELVRDIKDLRFGYDNDLSFENCHRGISPFAVMAVAMEHQAKWHCLKCNIPIHIRRKLELEYNIK